MEQEVKYRVRLRFRVQKCHNIGTREHIFSIGGHNATLETQSNADNPVKIADSEWLVINIRSIESKEAAEELAKRLKLAVSLSSIRTWQGVDLGTDVPTAGLGKIIKDNYKQQDGLDVRDNVHGIDVVEDQPNVRYVSFSMKGKVLTNGEVFLKDIDQLLGSVTELTQRAQDIILLLNYALMRPEPVAQIVYAISAVEMLGQTQKWNDNQEIILDDLSKFVFAHSVGTEEDRLEIVTAIGKGIHKLSLRQGVLRLLREHDLEHLKPYWDELYSERSTLVHGLAPRAGVDYSPLAHRAVSLCGYILLKILAKEMPGIDEGTSTRYFPN